jgi:tetratricopeptide (TPR) repeat protein
MSESAKKPLVIFTYSALVLSTLLVFWQVRNFDFVNYDDGLYVYENPQVLSGLNQDSITWAFTTNCGGYWQPLTWLSQMLNCQLFGPDPGWMHLVNVLLHLANMLLLFAVLKKMTGSPWPSAFVAAAFALHPMHVESVAWITERKDVLSTFFLLLTLAAYVSYVKRRSLAGYLLAVLLFVFGLMSKPMLVTLPFLLLLLDYWPLNRLMAQPATTDDISLSAADKHSILGCMVEKIPFFVIAVALSVVTILTQKVGGVMVDTTTIPLKARVVNAFLSYAKYIGKMFWPRDLAVLYPFRIGGISFWQVASCALLLLVISVLVICFGRKRRYLPAGWFWFVITLLPVIGLVQGGSQAYADRFTYVPYIGLFVMVAWGLPELLLKWPYRKIALSIAAAIALTAMGTGTYRQVSYWKNSFTLFTHAIEVTQNNDIIYNALGVAYGGLGRYQDAIDAYKQAIRIDPDYPEAHLNLGVAYCKLGRMQEAIEDFKEAIRGKPNYAEAYNNLGFVYDTLGRLQDAIDAYKQAIKIRPDNANAYYNLGLAYSKLGRISDAIDAYRQAIRIRPDDAEAHNSLAWLIATSPNIKDRQPNEAIRLAGRACELANYKNPTFLDTRAAAYASAGRFGEAVDTANKALSLADALNQPQAKDTIRYHLSLYTQGKPCIEPASKSLPGPNKP